MEVNKCFTVIPCFGNLADHNLRWESAIKTTIYREKNSNTFNGDRVFF